MIWSFLFTLLNMDRLKLIIICLLNANVNYMQQLHCYGFFTQQSMTKGWNTQMKRVNDIRDERFLKVLFVFWFFVCLLLQIFFLQERFPKMSSWQTASFSWQGNDITCLHPCGSRKLTIPRSALGEQILRHFNSKLQAQFPPSEWHVKCRIEHDA